MPTTVPTLSQVADDPNDPIPPVLSPEVAKTFAGVAEVAREGLLALGVARAWS